MSKSAISARDALIDLNVRVGEPDDYFSGRRTADTGLLQSIVLFARRPGCPIYLKEVNSFHHRSVLLIPLKGTGNVIVNGRCFFVEPGRALLISPYQFHSFFNTYVNRLEWLFIVFEGGTQFSEAVRMVRDLPEQFWNDLRVLVETYLKPDDEAASRQLVLRLMLLLSMVMEQEPLESSESAQTTAGGDLLMRIYELISKNMETALSASDISEALGVSESHLRNTFREATGYSIGSYMRIIRLYRATGLLLRHKMNVSEVAAACGWESAFSFSRAFTAHWGLSPRDFARKLGKPDADPAADGN